MDVQARSFVADRVRAFPVSAHDSLEIAWVERGAAHYRVGNENIALPAGAAIVVPPRREHATTFASSMAARSIHIIAPVAYGIAGALGVAFADPLVIRDARNIGELGAMIQRELAQPGPGQALLLDALVEATVIAALRHVPHRATAPDPRLARALELVYARYSDALTIDELARAAGMSRFHFSRAFRAAMGASPYQFVQRIRLERAHELLQQSRRSVTEVALAVGFSDLGRFAKAYRAKFGASPGSCRTAPALTR